MFSKTDNKILWLLKIFLAAPLALLLFVSASFLFPYTSIKAFLFRVIIEMAAIFYLYLAIKYKEFRPKFSFLNLAILLFLFISFLSALFGLNFSQSLWGDLERMLGVWGLMHFVAWFLMLASVFQKREEQLNLLRFSVAVASLVALLAIGQKFFSLGLFLPQADRVASTIGNPAFLGTYLLFNIFFGGYLFFNEFLSNKNSLKKFGYCVLCLVSCLALALTGTRGAFLGLLAGAVVFLALLVFRGFKKWPIIILAAIFFLTAVLFLARDTAFVKNNSILSRAVSISASGATIQSRLILWGDAWRAWQARPLLGAGPENFEIAVNQHLSPSIANYESFAFDRAHNFIFDYGVTIGWLGLLAYLAIFAVAGWGLIKIILYYNVVSFPCKRESTAWKSNLIIDSRLRGNDKEEGFYNSRKNKKDDFFFSVIFISLLVAYFVQNFFVFDTFISCLMLFFALAAVPPFYKGGVGGIYINNLNPSQPPFKKGGEKVAIFTFYKKIILSIFIIFIIFSLYFFNFKPFRASYLANQILSAPPEALTQIAPDNLEKIIALDTFAAPEIVYQIVIDYLDKISQAPQLTQNERFYKVAEEALRKSVERAPLVSRNYIALGWLNLYFSNMDLKKITAAIESAQTVKQLSPAKKDAYLILVAAYVISSQTDKAAAVVQEVEKISPDLAQSVGEYWEKIK